MFWSLPWWQWQGLELIQEEQDIEKEVQMFITFFIRFSFTNELTRLMLLFRANCVIYKIKIIKILLFELFMIKIKVFHYVT